MAEDTRPTWPFKTPMQLAEWLCKRHVDRIDRCRKLTPDFSTEEWLLLVRKAGDGAKEISTRVSVDALSANESEISFRPTHTSSLVYINPALRTKIDEIKAWDKKHDAERTTYERLKRKFEGDQLAAKE